jgi:DNA-binding transcriptional LysR family regulator
MKLSLEALQVLDAIDRKGSFASAADELHRVPSAVTYSVRQLEEGLGIDLFDRRGNRAILTEAGRELVGEGRRLLQAAADLECRVQQVARGWESELRIAVDTLIGIDRLYRLVEEFYAERTGTRLRLSHEVLGGTWDALASGRADLLIGATGAPPAGRNYAIRPLGKVDMVFVAAPFHPIAAEPQPLTDEAIQRHRAVSVADSSRLLPPRTVGLLSGQDTLTVPTMEAKASAHIAGLGVGFLPGWVARREAQAGTLVILEVVAPRPAAEMVVAFRPPHATLPGGPGQQGRGLQWFVKRLEDPLVAAELLT